MDGLYCGYAPRVLRRLFSRQGDEEVLLVGSKDGGLTILQRESNTTQFEIFKNIGRNPGEPLRKAIRVILDCGKDSLILGRDDGSLELINWRKEISPPAQLIHFFKDSSGESVRYATWLDRAQARLLVAYRRAGTRLLTFAGGIAGEEDLKRALKNSTEIPDVGGIRVAAAIPGAQKPDAPPNHFVLIDKDGLLWLWASQEGKPPKKLGEWSDLELPPATFEDNTYIGPAPEGGYKDIRGLIVTTDTGVFALDLRWSSWKKKISGKGSDWPQPTRLALPGGGRFCTAVTYTEVDSHRPLQGQLWLTNRKGESLLFENEPLTDGNFQSWAVGFRSSGRFQLDSQALTAVSWSKEDTVWLARACRDDYVRVLEYSVLRQMSINNKTTEGKFLRLNSKILPEQREIRESLKRFLVARNTHHEYDLESWPDYALLAELFDQRAGDPASSPDFFEYLSQPFTDVPVAILVSTALIENGSHQHLAAAVRLWSLCLLGITNRHQSPREEWYLGIIRFLRGLRQALGQIAEEYRPTLDGAIERAVRFTRKWGLYGQVNEIRQNLVVPLKILETQYEDGLDEIAYYGLLLRRSYSEVAQDIEARREGDHAWAIKSLRLGCGILVAGSWRRQGVTFFVLKGEGELSSELIRISTPDDLKSSVHDVSQADRDRYNFSRDILLLKEKGENEFSLLIATRENPHSDLREDLQLFSLELIHATESEWRLEAKGRARRLESRFWHETYGSAYRFLDLGVDGRGSHLIAVGLGGTNGQGEIALIKIAGSENLEVIDYFPLVGYGAGVLRPVGSRDLETLRNRVWSLAKLEVPGAIEDPSVKAFLAGCDNGEIWHVVLKDGERTQCHLVARLTSAIRALQAVPVKGKLRVFAGTKDGTIVAYQELAEENNLSHEYPYLAPLWATVEAEEICYIDRHQYRSGGEDFVFAVTRSGVLLAFDDCPEAADFDPKKMVPQRPLFPGIRWLRASTGGKIFAATSFENKLNIGCSAWRLVATASGDGCLRIISLHLPRYSMERKHQFLLQCSRLSRVTCDSLIEEVGDGDTLNGDRVFRVVEAAYQSVPFLHLIIVRILLDPAIEELAKERSLRWIDEIQNTDIWCLPQNIRPLLKLRRVESHAIS